MLLMQTRIEGPDEVEPYLQVDGSFFRLNFCANITDEQLPTSGRVTVTYSSMGQGVISSCTPPVLVPVQRRVLFGDDGVIAPTKPTFLIYLTTMCGVAGNVTADPNVSRLRGRLRQSTAPWFMETVGYKARTAP
jgi:hypothetical protein